MPDPARQDEVELTRRNLLISAGLTVATMAGGCQSTQKLEVSQSGAPKFGRFRAEYRFEQPDRLLARHFDVDPKLAESSNDGSHHAGPPEIVTVAAVSALPDARLKIECPHPNGSQDLALLTLTLSERRGRTAIVRQDVRQLSIPRSHIELLISDLAQRGYFDRPSDKAASQLAVQIDRGKIDRSWGEDPRLLDLAHQTLTAGTAAPH